MAEGADATALEASAAAPGASGAAPAAGTGASGAPGRRRNRNQEVQEIVDDLATESRRVTLLDRVESQLKGQPHVARLFFAFSIVDDRNIRHVQEEFSSWREKQEEFEELTGILLFIPQHAVHLLEGPPQMLFNALTFFQSLAVEVTAPVAGAAVRPAYISAVKVLHFSELHGVRTSASWCSHSHTGKSIGGQSQGLEQDNCSELAFIAYKKFLLVCLKVRDDVGDDTSPDKLATQYRKGQDMMPSVDEILVLLGKSSGEYFFSYAEFEKVFIAPFHLVLHSELLWPMPPALSY